MLSGLAARVGHELSGGAALEVGVLKTTCVDDGLGVDAIQVLEVGADVGVAVLQRFDVASSGYRGDLGGQGRGRAGGGAG